MKQDETTPAELDAMAVPEGDGASLHVSPDGSLDAALDAELKSSKALLAEDDARLSEEILKIPHHALDLSPVNSKIVVVKLHSDGGTAAILATPDGAHQLPLGDPAHRLPDGARIRKVDESTFIAEQLSPAEDRPLLVATSAGEAIARFIDHFHH